MEGHFDHRENPDLPLEEQYGPAHPIYLTEGGMLSGILGGARQIMVNSLHGQGINRLAPGIDPARLRFTPSAQALADRLAGGEA